MPTTASKFPCGVRSCTTAPGTSSSSAAASTAAWKEAGSMGFSAAPAGAAPVAVVAAGCAPFDVCDVVCSDVVEQPAITRAMPTASTVKRVVRGARRRPTAVRLGAFCTGESVIVGINASAAGFDTAPMSGTSWADLPVHRNPDARPFL
ncbi:hypothetical protein [Rhodococcus sp. JS3073]|uniref:hypothetical protein n=1 Tax=Rhodococcus sp. JS3073 TaxID=3002901 RepID=UPI00228695F3|nr:hypothetical protein [Rhodococcus sp. JS3073]WAM15107.1 hypothetical protein OYT95_38095 [Rhodococcus sp. JS3073]